MRGGAKGKEERGSRMERSRRAGGEKIRKRRREKERRTLR